MAALPPFSLLRIHRWADSLGATGAVLCALHCALLPLAIGLLPATAAGAIASDSFEWLFSLFASALAFASLWQGYRSHRGYHAWALVIPGLLAIWAGLLYSPLHTSQWPHALVMAAGGSLIALGHLTNLRLMQSYAGQRCCQH